MSFVLTRSITKCILFFVSCYSTSALLKIVFSKTVVDLKSCDIVNSVPNSSLIHTTQEAPRNLLLFRRALYLTCADEQLWRHAEAPALWLGKKT